MVKSKLTYNIVRIIIGLLFAVFGAMKFFPVPPESIPTGVAGEVLAGLTASGYFMPLLAICELLIGLMLLFNKWPALATIMLVPISLNILLFDIVLRPTGWLFGLIPIIVNAYLVYYHFDKYKPLLEK